MQPPFSSEPLRETLFVNIYDGTRPIPGFHNIALRSCLRKNGTLRGGLPHDDGAVSGIVVEGCLEYLSEEDGIRFLRECRRALRPGGVLRVATPDLEDILAHYEGDVPRSGTATLGAGQGLSGPPSEVRYAIAHKMGYRSIYNEEDLLRVGRTVGLAPMGRKDCDASEIDELRRVEARRSSNLIVEFKSRGRGSEGTPPTVSVLVPAYRPDFLDAALSSVERQTYPVSEVVVCDDSGGALVEKIVGQFAKRGLPCRYFRNEPPLGGMRNTQRCLDLSESEFIKILNDDDVLHPRCLEMMVPVLAGDPTITLVTSHRTRIDAQSHPLPDRADTRSIADEDSVFEGTRLIRYVTTTRLNVIGEPTTALFRRSDVVDIKPHLMAFDGVEFRGMADIALWANLMSRGDAAYLVESLSQFRIHESQRQRHPDVRSVGWLSWRRFPAHLRRLGMASASPVLLRRSLAGGGWRPVPGSRLKAMVYRAISLGRDMRRRLRGYGNARRSN